MMRTLSTWPERKIRIQTSRLSKCQADGFPACLLRQCRIGSLPPSKYRNLPHSRNCNDTCSVAIFLPSSATRGCKIPNSPCRYEPISMRISCGLFGPVRLAGRRVEDRRERSWGLRSPSIYILTGAECKSMSDLTKQLNKCLVLLVNIEATTAGNSPAACRVPFRNL